MIFPASIGMHPFWNDLHQPGRILMELQGRMLTREMQGEDVRLLQSELWPLGYGIPIDERERPFCLMS